MDVLYRLRDQVAHAQGQEYAAREAASKRQERRIPPERLERQQRRRPARNVQQREALRETTCHQPPRLASLWGSAARPRGPTETSRILKAPRLKPVALSMCDAAAVTAALPPRSSTSGLKGLPPKADGRGAADLPALVRACGVKREPWTPRIAAQAMHLVSGRAKAASLRGAPQPSYRLLYGTS
eukprot:scaffold5198_cov247-Pinguiococcus_pyrenoidosus.AAC.5